MLSSHMCLVPAGLNSAALDGNINAEKLSPKNHENLLSAINDRITYERRLEL